MITIITSLFKGGEYIKFYLENITKCIDYSKCEHLIFNIVDSNTENTTNIVKEYSNSYSNIKVINIKDDPGIYEIWNMGVRMASHKYILTSNIDDYISKHFLRLSFNYLELNKTINLVCFPVQASYIKNSNTFYSSITSNNKKDIWFITKNTDTFFIKHKKKKYDFYPLNRTDIKNKILLKKYNLFNKNKEHVYYNYFDKYDMIQIINNEITSHNIPHCCPVWRKSLHTKFGYFDEKEYGPYADYEFWLRCMDDTTLYGIIPIVSVIYYINPNSHNRRNTNIHILDNIYKKYYYIDSFNNKLLY
jgi:hypothetical protein